MLYSNDFDGDEQIVPLERIQRPSIPPGGSGSHVARLAIGRQKRSRTAMQKVNENMNLSSLDSVQLSAKVGIGNKRLPKGLKLKLKVRV